MANSSRPAAKHRILIVEDETTMANFIRAFLKRAGYDVVGIAATGQEALALVQEHAPDLVFMDIRLKGSEDGICTARLIRDTCDAAIIFLTGATDDETIDLAKDVAPEGYLIKPFARNEVEAMAKMALEKRRVERALRRSNAGLRAVIAASPDQIVRARRDGSLIEAPNALKNIDDILPPETTARARECVARCLDLGSIQRIEYSSRESGGKTRVFELRSVQIEGEEALVLIRDITESHTALERASESMRVLTGMANKIKGAKETRPDGAARELRDALEPRLLGLKTELMSCLSALPAKTPASAKTLLENLRASLTRTIEEVRRIP